MLTLWLSRFPAAEEDSYVFPYHRVACRGGYAEHHLYDVRLSRPIGSWKRAWKSACSRAGVQCRWHDLRHTFISRLAENPKVSEETIRALAGHVSKQMLQRYSHIRLHAKQAAIDAMQDAANSRNPVEIARDGAQNWAQMRRSGLN
jgi:integrase